MIRLFVKVHFLLIMTQTESSRFVFSMRGPNEDLNKFISTLFFMLSFLNLPFSTPSTTKLISSSTALSTACTFSLGA